MNIEIIVCKNCNKEFESEVRFHKKFCCHKCAMIFNNKSKGGQHLSEENKQKISETMKNKWKNGEIKKEQLNNWIKSGQEASIEKMKGKTFEEIYGKEEADKKRKHYSESRIGENNSQSLKNIANRKKCSLENARTYTSCYGRLGEKHPMFGKQQSDKAVNAMMEKLQIKCKYVSIGYFNNILWQGSYELAYLIYCYEHNINIKRYNLDPIKYTYKNKIHRYYPDFIVNEKIIVECKGRLDERVEFKKLKAIEIYGKENYLLLDYDYFKTIKPKCNVKNYFKTIKEKYNNLFEIIFIPLRYKQEYLNDN